MYKWYKDKGLWSFVLLVSLCAVGLGFIGYASLGDPVITINCIGNCWDE